MCTLFSWRFLLYQTVCFSVPGFLLQLLFPLFLFLIARNTRLLVPLELVSWNLRVKQSRNECSRKFYGPSLNSVDFLGMLVRSSEEWFHSVCIMDFLASVSRKKLCRPSCTSCYCVSLLFSHVSLKHRTGHILWIPIMWTCANYFFSDLFARWLSDAKLWRSVQMMVDALEWPLVII